MIDILCAKYEHPPLEMKKQFALQLIRHILTIFDLTFDSKAICIS